MRGVLASLLVTLGLAAPAMAGDVRAARFGDATDRYDHGVLGDAMEWGSLTLDWVDGPDGTAGTGGPLQSTRITLPRTRVFEDLAPRVVTVDAKGTRLALVVESDLSRGARLALYGPEGVVAATPFIGTRHRWLAPVGAADFDGDGTVEIAYVDRPHLLRRLRLFRFAWTGDHAASLTEIAALEGLTNHRIGDAFIQGGIAHCPGQTPAIVTADAGWANVMVTRLTNGTLTATPAGRYTGPDSLNPETLCAR